MTLSAKPWNVTHCFTWIPMLAIFRPSVQTPVRPGIPFRRDADRVEPADQDLFELAQIPVEIPAPSAEIENRISHELPGGVQGHVAAALDVEHLEAPRRQQPMPEAAGWSRGCCGPSVTTGSCSTRSSRSSAMLAGHAPPAEPPLQLQHLAVGAPAQVDHRDGRSWPRPGARRSLRPISRHQAARPPRATSRPARPKDSMDRQSQETRARRSRAPR